MIALRKYTFSLEKIFQHYVSSSHDPTGADHDIEWDEIVDKNLRMNFYDFLLFCKRKLNGV